MASIDTDPVKAVYELREAAFEHGKAIANLETDPTGGARDDALATKMVLEEKTVAAIDECSDKADAAAEAATEAATEAAL